MGRKKQNLDESPKRLLILKTASKMFMTLSYDEVSMDALADAIPVSKRTLYNHYKDKKALFSAVMQNRCQMVFSKLSEILQDNKSPEYTLTNIGQQYLGIVLEPDAVNIYRTAITESQKFPELGKLFYEAGPKRSTAILADYLKSLHTKKILNVPNPELAANTFMGMLLNRIQMKCMLGFQKRVSEEEKNDIVRYVVKVFLYGNTAG
jgi:TetR/AcrR family transcriptional repressor of mexJK operon